MDLLFLLLIAIAYKFFRNLSYYLRVKTLHGYFIEFTEHKRTNMNMYRQEVISLFKKANVKDVITPVSEPIGYGQIMNASVSVFSMFPSLRPVFLSEALNMFEDAEGAFRKNMIDSIDPLYWIDFIIFLPKELLAYLGLKPEATTYKLCNVLLTSAWWISGTFIIFFKPQIKQYLIELIGNL